MSDQPVVVLAGGTGGAKLARGMLDVVGADLGQGVDARLRVQVLLHDQPTVEVGREDLVEERGHG